MPRYYFDIANGHRLIDPSGLDCSDDADALAKAKVIAFHISEETPRSEVQRYVSVLDAERSEISNIPVYPGPDALAAE
jgi:hypothetical protein